MATRTLKQTYKAISTSSRAVERCKSAGIKVTHHRRLMKLTNVRTIWGGHLADATCHYRNAWEVSGNTYEVRTALKAAGFKWDAEHKVWWSPAGSGVAQVIARALAGK